MYEFFNLEKEIGYKFKNKQLITIALTHPSYFVINKNKNNSYEKLELLGDAVLSLVIIEFLLKQYKNLTEGEISKRKANLVCSDTLSTIGKKLI